MREKMQSFKKFSNDLNEEKIKFTNWVLPSDKDLALEYKIEYQIKPLKNLTNDAFPTVQDFIKAVKKAKTINLTPAVDRKIEYRSRTKSKEAIISLIKGYASYPEFRNEKTVEAIYQGYRDNKPMKMPFILKFSNGNLRIMSGNTRTDIAQHLGITPKGVLIEVPSK
jgi:hypothetical protein